MMCSFVGESMYVYLSFLNQYLICKNINIKSESYIQALSWLRNTGAFHIKSKALKPSWKEISLFTLLYNMLRILILYQWGTDIS